MARYLSPEWIAELGRAASEVPARLGDDLADVSLVVEQHVLGTPDGDVAYVTRIDHGRIRVEAGSAPDAELVLVTDYETARALTRGELNAQQAFAAGRLKARGRIDRLVAQARALAAIGAGLDAVRDRTEFD